MDRLTLVDGVAVGDDVDGYQWKGQVSTANMTERNQVVSTHTLCR